MMKYMGISQSRNNDVFVLMCRGDLEVCAIGIFSNLEKAIQKAETMGNERPLWIERFRLNDPHFYEEDDDCIAWRN